MLNISEASPLVGDAHVVVRDIYKRFPIVERHPFSATRWEGDLVLDDVDLDVKRLEFLSIIGPSGCGKTTLLRLIAGVDKPSSGLITIGGERLEAPRRESAMVFQHIGLLKWRTVRDNAALGLQFKLHRKLNASDWDKVDHYIDVVGLSKRAAAYPRQISGGMQQRVGIARALATEPDLLLMDEPFGALDALTRRVLQDELLALSEQYQATVVFITHDIEEAICLSDRIVVMSTNPGRVAEIIDVNIPRPRNAHEIRSSKEFVALANHLWESIRDSQERAFERDDL